ncbi:MAG: hypothetical protein ACK5Q5_16395 [Planctomycetaceae bacterium]
MLTILSYGEDKCIWCCQTTEGVHAKFQDGLTGFLCRKDFWSAVKARSSPAPASVGESTPRKKE